MAIACSTSAFNIPLGQALKKVGGLGFSHVDLIAIPGWPHVIPQELADNPEAGAAKVDRLLKENNLTAVAMNMAVGNLHDRGDAAVCATRLKQVEAMAHLMNTLGIRVASFYPGYRADHRNWDDVLADSCTSMREILDVGASSNVTFAVELHFATPFETIEQGQRLLNALPALKVAIDPSHYAMQGIHMRALETFMDRVVHVHMRDAGPGKMQTHFGQGSVDFDCLLSMLKRHGYNGNISVEYLPDDHEDMTPDITATRDKVATYFQE